MRHRFLYVEQCASIHQFKRGKDTIFKFLAELLDGELARTSSNYWRYAEREVVHSKKELETWLVKIIFK
jgi:hypothetical protein